MIVDGAQDIKLRSIYLHPTKRIPPYLQYSLLLHFRRIFYDHIVSRLVFLRGGLFLFWILFEPLAQSTDLVSDLQAMHLEALELLFEFVRLTVGIPGVNAVWQHIIPETLQFIFEFCDVDRVI